MKKLADLFIDTVVEVGWSTFDGDGEKIPKKVCNLRYIDECLHCIRVCIENDGLCIQNDEEPSAAASRR